ncbi:MAG: hypothetical protein AB8E15_09750 [Bdellovibrionales bacterium]
MKIMFLSILFSGGVAFACGGGCGKASCQSNNAKMSCNNGGSCSEKTCACSDKKDMKKSGEKKAEKAKS